MRFLAVLLTALLVTAGLAHAQDTTVSVAPLVDFVLPVLQTLISGVLAIGLPIVLTRLSQRYGLQIEQEKRDALQVTFTNAAGGLLQKLGDQARTLKVDMRNPDVAAAVGRAMRGAPDALRWAGLSEEEIARRILEKLPQIGPAPSVAADTAKPVWSGSKS